MNSMVETKEILIQVFKKKSSLERENHSLLGINKRIILLKSRNIGIFKI